MIWFTEADVEAVSGTTSFVRGEDYVRYVHGLQVKPSQALASIQAKRVYRVELEWSNGALGGWCSCPHHESGNFCKHLVAVALAVLDSSQLDSSLLRGGSSDLGGSAAPGDSDPLDAFVAGLGEGALVDLVRELVANIPEVRRVVQLRAISSSGASLVSSAELIEQVNGALRTRGYVDYRESFDLARDAEAVLDDLHDLLDAGAGDVVRPALERALVRLRKITLTADDSSGVIGSACQRAADLHARACCAAPPADPVALARWLIKFRADSPGWPETTLAMYAAAFDAKALAVYRKAVHAQAAKVAGSEYYERLDVDRMLLELADYDGDLDEAIRLLSADPEHTQFGAIVMRLSSAGRNAEALRWLEMAHAAGRLQGHGSSSNEYWISPADAAALYLAADRVADALAVLRDQFARRPGPETLRALLEVGERAGTAGEERRWAIETAEGLAGKTYGSGADLILIALADEDLDLAWSYADRFGAGHAWKALALASAKEQPLAAAALYKPQVEERLLHANTKVYPEVATLLSTMRDLYRAGGDEATFDAFLAEVRTTYVRRTSLIAALDRQGLRPDQPS